MKSLQIMIAATAIVLSTSAQAWNQFNNNGYAPRGYQPLTAEQMKEQRAAFEKNQKEAYERHQEALKNFQTQAPVRPNFNNAYMPADVKARRDAFMKEMEIRRDAAQKRHEEMIKKYNEARTPALPVNNG